MAAVRRNKGYVTTAVIVELGCGDAALVSMCTKRASGACLQPMIRSALNLHFFMLMLAG